MPKPEFALELLKTARALDIAARRLRNIDEPTHALFCENTSADLMKKHRCHVEALVGWDAKEYQRLRTQWQLDAEVVVQPRDHLSTLF